MNTSVDRVLAPFGAVVNISVTSRKIKAQRLRYQAPRDGLVALHLACFRDYQDKLASGEVGTSAWVPSVTVGRRAMLQHIRRWWAQVPPQDDDRVCQAAPRRSTHVA